MTDENEAVLPVDTETPEAEITGDEVDDDLDDGDGTPPPPEETTEQLRARLAASEDKRKRLFARLQREKNKPATVPAAPASKKVETSTGLSKGEAILYAKGFDEAEVDYAQKVATLQGVSLTEAVKDELFTTWKSNKAEAKKKEDAQLGTSRGARTTVKKSFDTPGLSDEDHKAMFKEQNG